MCLKKQAIYSNNYYRFRFCIYNLEFLANTRAQAESLLYWLELAARDMYFKQDGVISTLNGKLLKLVDQ